MLLGRGASRKGTCFGAEKELRHVRCADFAAFKTVDRLSNHIHMPCGLPHKVRLLCILGLAHATHLTACAPLCLGMDCCNQAALETQLGCPAEMDGVLDETIERHSTEDVHRPRVKHKFALRQRAWRYWCLETF